MHYLENDRIRIAVAAHGAELCGIYDKKRMRLYSFLLSERYAAASTATKG